MRVLVCGGRDYCAAAAWNWLEDNARDYIAEKLVTLSASRITIDTIIHGGARGADEGAAHWGHSEGANVLCFPADWKKHGKAAGPIRNAKMLHEGKPDVVIALPGGRGTANMVGLAKAAGLPVVEVAPPSGLVSFTRTGEGR